jgi:CheY-like chemotaxis protein
VLRNLVSNAIKYTVQGQVTLRATRVEDTAIRIDVVDTGVGIAADQVRYIYDEFYQIGVSANSSREGYGLGLSIVQRIVHLLGVQLSVTSELGKGSLFSLVLPAATGVSPAPRSESAPLRAAAPRAARLRVLLVEDDPGVRDATRMLLKVEGYEVTAVASLAQALKEISQATRPDLLVTDYHLANGETGTETIAALRQALGVPLKAVLITGDTAIDTPLDPDLRVASKPIRAEELLTLMRAML